MAAPRRVVSGLSLRQKDRCCQQNELSPMFGVPFSLGLTVVRMEDLAMQNIGPKSVQADGIINLPLIPVS